MAAPTNQRQQDHIAELGVLSSTLPYSRELVVQGRWWLPSAFIHFLLHWLGLFARLAFFLPVTFLISPPSTFYSVLGFPLLFVFFGGLAVLFWIGSYLGGGAALNWIAGKWAPNPTMSAGQGGGPVGYTIANWANPQILDSTGAQNAINAARFTLSNQLPTTYAPQSTSPPLPFNPNIDFPPGESRRIFDVDVCKTLAFMTSVVYERSDEKVMQASRIAKTVPDLAGNAQQAAINQANNLLLQSEQRIQAQAQSWGLAYEGISDLSSIGSAFASIFYTGVDKVSVVPAGQERLPANREKHPFIVLVMKGTTPTSYADFLVNGTISKVSATTFLGGGAGQAHEGYYTSLFASNKNGDRARPTGQIVKSLKNIAAELSRLSGGRHIPLWITGHSLGACLASLLFARFLHEPRDLGPHILLRDAYTICSPRNADGDLANKFEESLVRPTDRPNILWRVTMPKDFGPHIPPGAADDEKIRSILPSLSPLNFAHLSSATIRLEHTRATGGNPPANYIVKDDNFHTRTRIEVVSDRPPGPYRTPRQEIRRLPGLFNPVRFGLAWFLPSFLFNHYPSTYLTMIDQMRVDKVGGWQRM
ncbi:hypothetical protein BCR35DRAFT_331788 [Leucosporidium creatinivorum]|uniref:Fungal lipase-type domain-containing protein n=1 Tax=Leucosporidium creatinivorum TaxID=106004 RepID=A0A1Y2FBL4_9BASI|nr:hypothetical protein BCR35DRAFT_331788 [Leucosporidium creatinivorum]